MRHEEGKEPPRQFWQEPSQRSNLERERVIGLGLGLGLALTLGLRLGLGINDREVERGSDMT